VEPHRRLSGGQALDLDVAPADAPDAEPEHLRDRLLGRPAAGGQWQGGRARSDAQPGQDRRRALTRKRSRVSAIRAILVDAQLGRARRASGAAALGAVASADRALAYSTVTDLARFRGWSTSVPRAIAVW
jgi:hypothetical protein